MMVKLFNFIKVFVAKILAFFPSKLPKGTAEFEAWATSILSTYEFPDNDSTRFALAVMVLHLESTVASKAKYYFAKALHKAASNQVVSQVIQDLKTKQQTAQKQAEDTASKAQGSGSALQPVQ